MAVLKKARVHSFTQIDNRALKDESLSLKSRGLLVSLLSLPDNWRFSEKGLTAIFPKDGIDSIRTGVKELENGGYLSRQRARDSKGRLSNTQWIISDSPKLDFPTLDKPILEKPTQENPMTNTRYKESKKEEINKEEINPPLYVIARGNKFGLGKFDNVFMTESQVAQLKEECPTDYIDRVDYLSSWLNEDRSRHKDNHLATILLWKAQDEKKAAEKATRSGSPAKAKTTWGSGELGDAEYEAIRQLMEEE